VNINQWINQNELSLLTPEEIISCEDRGTLWDEDFIPNYRPELYIGVDVGRTRDLTVIWVLEMVGDVAWTREVVTMQGASFDWQRGEIRRRIMERGVVKCCIDKGGIGTQLAEELTSEFPYIVEGVALNEGTQGRVALRVREQFRGKRIRIPVDPVIRADFQQVSDVGVGTAGLPKIRTGRTELGHADRFWGMALAVEALPIVGKPVCRSLPVAVRSIHASRGR
jgi:phage FluMu gp28-like protein